MYFGVTRPSENASMPFFMISISDLEKLSQIARWIKIDLDLSQFLSQIILNVKKT